MLIWCAIYLADVPEGSFIVRAHTPMSNLFSCLWFNEVDRFTSRDQLSFAYTFLKLRRMNPDRPFYLNMFKVLEIFSKIKNLLHILQVVVKSYRYCILHAIFFEWSILYTYRKCGQHNFLKIHILYPLFIFWTVLIICDNFRLATWFWQMLFRKILN